MFISKIAKMIKNKICQIEKKKLNSRQIATLKTDVLMILSFVYMHLVMVKRNTQKYCLDLEKC